MSVDPLCCQRPLPSTGQLLKRHLSQAIWGTLQRFYLGLCPPERLELLANVHLSRAEGAQDKGLPAVGQVVQREEA